MNTAGIRGNITQDEATEAAADSIRLGQLLDQAALLAIDVGVTENGFVDGARNLYRSVVTSLQRQTAEILKAAGAEPHKIQIVEEE